MSSANPGRAGIKGTICRYMYESVGVGKSGR